MAGTDGAPGRDAVLEVVDPCGPGADGEDEVLLQLNDGRLIAWYLDEGLAVIGAGTWRTTDAQHCVFTVDADGEVTW